MNNFIKEQLKNCKIADVPEFDDNTLSLTISGPKKIPTFQFGKYYKITIENYIVNPPPNFDLASNWNNGTKPTDTVLNIEIIQATSKNLEEAKMIKVLGRCEPSGDAWEGWLPKKAIIKAEELK